MSKKPAGPKRIYWDSCVFLSLIEGDPVRLPVLRAILSDMDQGNIVIFTSVLSIAEVAYGKVEKDQKALDKATEREINKLWNPLSPFKHRTIVSKAQVLVRQSMAAQCTIKPPDAIHLATAMQIGATEFQTFDDFKGRAGQVSSLSGLKVGPPSAKGMIVFPIEPAETGPVATSSTTEDATRRPLVTPARKKAAKFRPN